MLFTLLVSLIQSCSSIQTYKINEPFDITLDNEAVGGFQWHYKAIPEVEKIDSTTITIEEEGKFSYYKKRFNLKGVKEGKYELVFFQQQPFNVLDSIPEEYIKKFKVKIKK